MSNVDRSLLNMDRQILNDVMPGEYRPLSLTGIIYYLNTIYYTSFPPSVCRGRERESLKLFQQINE